MFTLQGVHDAEGIRALLAQDKVRDVVIVGGGLIGIETTEALVQRGCRVTVVEMMAQILRILDVDMVRLVEQHMESHGVRVLGSTVLKVFDFCVARTGLSESTAKAQGCDVVNAIAPAPDKTHFMPGAKLPILKLIADRKSRKLLGAQAVGPGAGDKRIDVAATALTAGMSVDQLANADLCYAPPYAPAMDNIITAANALRNKLDGHMDGVSVDEVHEMQQKGQDLIFLDVRSPKEYEQVRLPGSTLIPLGALRGRLAELPGTGKS